MPTVASKTEALDRRLPSRCRRSLGTRGLASLGPQFAQEVGRAALEGDPRVTGVKVFGSYARGTATLASDLDVAVFYDGSQEDALDVVGNVAPAVWRHCRMAGLECDVVALANGGPALRSPLAARILEEGVDVA